MNYLLPYRILFYFNLATLVLFAFSPIEPACHGTHWITFFYVFLNILCWRKGYKLGIKKGGAIKVSNRYPLSSISTKVLVFFFIFHIITLLPKYAYELFLPIFDISGMINRVSIGLYDPYYGYHMDNGIPPYNWSIYFLICIVDGVFFIVGLLSWKKLKTWVRILFLMLCLIEALKWFGKGTNFGVIMMLVSILFAYLARKEPSEQTRRYSSAATIMMMLLVPILALWVFSHNMEARSGGDFENVSESVFNLNHDSPINLFVLNSFPLGVVALYSYLVAYLTGGYTHLECAFQCPFDWTMFMGSNPLKAKLADFVFGSDFDSSGYPFTIYDKFGVDPYVSWHSCYAWLANDVSLLFVPFLVFLIGNYTGVSLVLFKKNNDLLSGIIFIIFTCMCFFFFANNNYISSVFYSFIFVFPLWYYTRIIRIHLS